MGNLDLIATTNAQTLGIRAVLGSFVVILFILVFYNLFKTNHKINGAAFASIVGVIIVGTLIMFVLAVDSIIYSQTGQL